MINILIGTEPMQYIAGKVLASSILRTTNEPVHIVFSGQPHGYSGPGIRDAPGHITEMRNATSVKNGTKFSIFRWLVPAVPARE